MCIYTVQSIIHLPTTFSTTQFFTSKLRSPRRKTTRMKLSMRWITRDLFAQVMTVWWRRLCTRVPRSASPSSPTGWGIASTCSAGQLVTSPVRDTSEPSVADMLNFALPYGSAVDPPSLYRKSQIRISLHADPDADPDPGIKNRPERQKLPVLYYNVYMKNIRFFLLVLNEFLIKKNT